MAKALLQYSVLSAATLTGSILSSRRDVLTAAHSEDKPVTGPAWHAVMEAFLDSKVNILLLLNALFNVVVVLFHITVHLFFGKLRELERKHVRYCSNRIQ
jgi:hypothetical protein